MIVQARQRPKTEKYLLNCCHHNNCVLLEMMTKTVKLRCRNGKFHMHAYMHECEKYDNRHAFTRMGGAI